MTATTSNGNGTEPDANALALEALESEAKRGGLARLPRRGEDRDAYLLAIARLKGAIAQDAHVADPAGMVRKLLAAAESDELFAPGSPISKALRTGAAVWSRMNTDAHGVGEASYQSRSGVHVAVAHIVSELQRDPARAQRLSLAEATLLAFYAGDEIVAAVQALRPAIDAAHQHVRETAEAELARPMYDGVLPEPPPPLPEPVPMGHGLQLNPRSLKRITSASDLRKDDHGI